MTQRIYRDRFLVFIFIAVFTLLIVTINEIMPAKQSSDPIAVQGNLDLTDSELSELGAIKLNGDWEFYPNELLDPEDFKQGRLAGHYLPVPSSWNQVKMSNGQKMGSWGFGTYRLRILIQPTEELLGIKKNAIRMSDRLYVNGELRGESGQVGITRAQYEPENTPYESFFYVQGNQVEIIIQAANYDYYQGGIGLPLHFGLSESILFTKYTQNAIEIAGTLVFIVFGIFYLTLFFIYLRDGSLLIFGAYFIFFGATFMFNGEKTFMQFFPGVPFEIAWKLKDISSYITVPLLCTFTYRMIDTWKFRKLLYIPGLIYAIYTLIIVILPYRFHVPFQIVLLPGSVVFYLGLMIFLLIGYLKQDYGKFDKTGLRLFMAAIIVVSISMLNMSFHNISWNSNMFVSDVAFFIFLIMIALMLAHQYYRTYSSMQMLNDKLKLADQMKDDFLIRTSHELKTPLHGIIHLSQALLEMPIQSETIAADKLALIRNTAYRMSSVVNDLIDLAKIKENRLDIRMSLVDLVTCTSVVFEVFGFLARQKNIQLVHKIAPDASLVMADENRLLQILYNLIDNSLKHTEQGSITIASYLDQANVILTVEDTGSGIPIGSREIIFLPYERGADASELDNRGIGIGLSIVDELAKLMGGQAYLDWSEENMGSRFAVRVQAVAPSYVGMDQITDVHLGDAGQEIAADLIPNASEKEALVGEDAYTVLVVDDEVMNVEVLNNILTGEGYKVLTAYTGKDALSRIGSKPKPDIVLLDVMLPGSSGYDICRTIRKEYSLIELPILFISVRNSPADIETGLAAGGNDYLSKPFDAGEIRARIRTLLTVTRLATEAAANEMAFLQSQIKPHFLYNTLGTIMSLCYTDASKAGELLGSFSTYLRIIFQADHKDEWITLSKELELVQAYIHCEKARFGDRLQVYIGVDEELRDCKIPLLSVQPLIENAIRHGVTRKLSGGSVWLSIQCCKDGMEIAIMDNGVGMTTERMQELRNKESTCKGVGLANINQRIYRLTGEELRIESTLGEGTKITMWLPIKW